MAKRKLGRGLSALLGRHTDEVATTDPVLQVPIEDIRPNPWQPRGEFDIEAQTNLVTSIRAKGVLQPIILRRQEDETYEIVAGERRWRAAKEAGLDEIPAIIRDVGDAEMLELALIENIQREDLNPIDRAKAYASLMKDLGWTQEELGGHMSQARATIANTLRLLELPDEIQALVSRGTISGGHGRALLAVRDANAQARLCQRILKEGLSVRQAEEIASGSPGAKSKAARFRSVPAHIRELQERLQGTLGAKVTIRERKKGGRITIDFASHDDFERILALLEPAPASEGDTSEFHV